jgi:hypothetical protein
MAPTYVCRKRKLWGRTIAGVVAVVGLIGGGEESQNGSDSSSKIMD